MTDDTLNSPLTRPVAESGVAQNRLSRRGFIQASGGLILAGGAVAPLSRAVAAEVGNQSGNCDAANAGNDTIDTREMEARYQRAEQMYRVYRHKEKLTYNTNLNPHWFTDGESFWYQRETKTGAQYRIVNAVSKSNNAAFDHRALARALADASGEKVDADHLPLSAVDIDFSPRRVTFTAFERRWRYDDNNRQCTAIEPWSQDWAISPDGKKAVMRRDHNLWLLDLASGREVQLTTDGHRQYSYGDKASAYGRVEYVSGLGAQAVWSPDSARILTVVRDTREVVPGPPLVQYVPPDGAYRPGIVDEERRVAFAQDEHVEVYRFLSIDVASGNIVMADYRPSTILYPPYLSFVGGHRGWWDEDNRHAWYVDLERGGRTGRLLHFDTYSGKVRVVIEESADSRFPLIPFSHLCPMMVMLPGSDETVWYSERSGMGHLYLYDLKSGREKHAITRGDWMVRNILHVDAERRELLIQTAGRVEGRNPYYCDICRVDMDTGELTTLATGDYDHLVQDGRSRNRPLGRGPVPLGASENGNYLVVTRSRSDQAPQHLLLDRSGKQLMEVEIPDLSGLPDDWQWPEPMMLKAADGETDIYGVVVRPPNFSPDKTWPVVDVSLDTAAPVGSFNNGGEFWLPYLISQLGFVVVMIESRGSGLRGTAFYEANDPLATGIDRMSKRFNQADNVAGIQQMAARYPWMDIDRVGVCGLNCQSTAVVGMFRYPEFYKVGVNLSVLIDARVSVGAFSMSEEENEPHIEDLAGNLRGKLLLVHNMLDNVAYVGGTLRIVQALQDANKPIDMLLLPNEKHVFPLTPLTYCWDYLVKHLLAATPPREARLAAE